jgi:CDP-6-deoxy-D-xylo-4-hexulose-3-dehydrase
VAALTSGLLGERRLRPGDEFITTPVSFPTTVNPGIQYGLRPIFVDVAVDSLNVQAAEIEKAVTKKTKLIMLAHTLGKPFDLTEVMRLVKKYNLWLIEDCCDALGSKYKGKYLGKFGQIATFSFYPAHQITMGEGGAVVTDDPLLHKAVRRFRDWGRDCWCGTGKDNTCKRRFEWKLGELPKGYDHKYIYSEIGYNLKLTDFQAAIGLAQLKRLPGFIKKRQRNYGALYRFFKKYQKYFKLMENNSKEEVSYFGFPVLVKEEAPFTRNELTEYLEKNKIGTRNVFAGNLLRNPGYIAWKNKFRVMGEMKNADLVMNNAFWLGVWPGIDGPRREYIMKKVRKFLEER